MNQRFMESNELWRSCFSSVKKLCAKILVANFNQLSNGAMKNIHQCARLT